MSEAEYKSQTISTIKPAGGVCADRRVSGLSNFDRIQASLTWGSYLQTSVPFMYAVTMSQLVKFWDGA